jgi:hypothetical protein
VKWNLKLSCSSFWSTSKWNFYLRLSMFVKLLWIVIVEGENENLGTSKNTCVCHCFIFCVFKMLNWRTENKNCFCQCVLRRINNVFTLQTSIVSTVTTLWARWWKNRGIPCGEDVFFLYLKYTHWLWCPPSPLFSGYQGGFFAGGKMAVAWSWLLTSHYC